MISTAAILEGIHLGRRHPDQPRWLLEDVSLGVRPGEALAVTGASGSGKTLLLRALAMLDPLDAGEVRFHDKTLHHHVVPDFRRQAIYLHQRPVMLGDTVEETLRQPFSLAVHRERRFERERIVELLGRVGRDESFLDKSTANLSGGESQIVALLRALQLDPAILLLDEPTAALDRPAAAAVEHLLRDWLLEAPPDRALVWVGHDTAQIERVADRILHIEAGRMIREDVA